MRPTLLLTVCLSAVMLPAVATARAADYIAEHQYDTRVHRDDAAVNVRITSNRWPDCTTLESTIQSIFRIEGVADKSDQAKALAMWKWFRIMVSGTGGGYAYEDVGGKWQIVKDPHKILTVYGHHQCDGQSWAMVPLWRAAGYMAFDQCHHGHTIASLRYRDADGRFRYHDLDPQGRFYWWNSKAKRIGTWRMPLATGTVQRHLLTPLKIHSLRTSLRVGEKLIRWWNNDGYVVPSGRPMAAINERYARYYRYEKGKKKGIYAVAGMQTQRLHASLSPEKYAAQLAEDSTNTACSPRSKVEAALHPKAAGREAVFVYRLPPPYVAVTAEVQADLLKSAPSDTCRLELSLDGGPWQTIFEKESVGGEKAKLSLALDEKKAGKPSVYSAYDVRVRLVAKTDGNVRGVGCSGLSILVYRMFNKRTLPNLMPGENVFRMDADRIPSGTALRLYLTYFRDDEIRTVDRRVSSFPYYFRIDEPGWALRKISNYDQDFNNETVRMADMHLSLVPADGVKASPSLPPAETEAKFAKAFPHPNVQPGPREVKAAETDVIQTNGFFPQSRERREPDERMTELIAIVRAKVAADGGSSVAGWRAAQELGCYPAALDELLAALPKANIDMTMFLCKALAQIGDKKAVAPLLAKWKRLAPRGAPGTRYIPDVLAVIGDERVVPALVAPLKKSRFDYRFHIAHALGELGGELAEKTLEGLAARDPFRAVREEAKAALAKRRGAR